jgi:hypothetical protein
MTLRETAASHCAQKAFTTTHIQAVAAVRAAIDQLGVVGGVTVPVVIHWPLVCVTSDQQRSRPLRISCGSAGTWRDLLLSTACSASQARALIGAITSRLVGLWLLRGCSVGTISILRLFGQCADLSNFIAAVLQVCSTLVNVTISRVVVSDTTRVVKTGSSQGLVAVRQRQGRF